VRGNINCNVVDVKLKLRSPSKIAFDMNAHKPDRLNYSISIPKILDSKFEGKVHRTEHVI
jgi:hypothetical protein